MSADLLLMHGGDFKPLVLFLAAGAVAVVLALLALGWGVVKLVKFFTRR